jgi:hypothetical protein
MRPTTCWVDFGSYVQSWRQMEATNKGHPRASIATPKERPRMPSHLYFTCSLQGKPGFQYGSDTKGKKGFQGKETVVFVPLGLRRKMPPAQNNT